MSSTTSPSSTTPLMRTPISPRRCSVTEYPSAAASVTTFPLEPTEPANVTRAVGGGKL